jgi:NAD(P)-dependent dehydrogenase (short-subunit alcohol dehydrogenase family)
MTGARRYSPLAFYAQSKLANVLFGLELDRRLRAAGIPVRSLLAHPGFSATNLQTSGPTGLYKWVGMLGNRFVAQDVEMGVLPELYAATARQAESGQFIGPDGPSEDKGYPTVVKPSASAQDLETAERLWDLSEEMTDVSYQEFFHR